MLRGMEWLRTITRRRRHRALCAAECPLVSVLLWRIDFWEDSDFATSLELQDQGLSMDRVCNNHNSIQPAVEITHMGHDGDQQCCGG